MSYSRPRTYTEEVTADAPANWWRLREAAGTTAAAAAGAVAGTYAAGTTLDLPGPILSEAASRAVAFDGASGRVSFGDVLDLIGDVIGVEAWVYFAALAATQPVLEKFGTGGNYRFQVSATGVITWQIRSAAGALSSCTTLAGAIVPGAWHHVVCQHRDSDDRGEIFVNGRLVGLNTAMTVVRGDTGTALNFGRSDNNGIWMTGQLAEPAIYTSWLAAERPDAHYRAAVALGGEALPRVFSRFGSHRSF